MPYQTISENLFYMVVPDNRVMALLAALGEEGIWHASEADSDHEERIYVKATHEAVLRGMIESDWATSEALARDVFEQHGKFQRACGTLDEHRGTSLSDVGHLELVLRFVGPDPLTEAETRDYLAALDDEGAL